MIYTLNEDNTNKTKNLQKGYKSYEYYTTKIS